MPVIAVALSGGADSMALALCLKDWADKTGNTIETITIDHGLRSESAQEAAWVADQMRKHGIKHTILTWTGKKPKTRIEETARKARYGLLADYCFKNGILYLAAAHTLDDQAETVEMRKRKKSTEKGLAGMSAVRNLKKVVLIRPFLKTTRKEIEAYLKSRNQSWAEDSSNRSGRFERNRLRKTGFEKEKNIEKSIEYAKKRQSEEKQCRKAVSYKVMDKGVLLKHPVCPDFFSHVLQVMGGTDYAPDKEKCASALKSEKRRTLNHCLISPRKAGILVRPEHRKIWAFCLEDSDVFTYL